jgi:hypothetical protein
MATIPLPQDFRSFLKLLISNNVEFLLIGGYAVNYYGYARATADLDVWIAVNPDNARRVTDAVHEFGFPSAETADFMAKRKVIRMGSPPLRLEILTLLDVSRTGTIWSSLADLSRKTREEYFCQPALR